MFSINQAFGGSLFVALSLFNAVNFKYNKNGQIQIKKYNSLIKKIFIMLIIPIILYITIFYPLMYTYKNALYVSVIINFVVLKKVLENSVLNRISQRTNIDLDNKSVMFKIIVSIDFLICLILFFVISSFKINTIIISIGGLIFGFIVSLPSQIIHKDYLYLNACEEEATIDLKNINIRSLNIYSGMVISSKIAMYVFVMMYILYMIYFNDVNYLINLVSIFFAIISAIFFVSKLLARFFKKISIDEIDKNKLFITGIALMIFSTYSFTGQEDVKLYILLIKIAVLLCGVVCMMAASTGMQKDMLRIVKLYDDTINIDTIKKRTYKNEQWANIISESIFLIILVFILTNPIYQTANINNLIEYAPYVGTILICIPIIFLGISLWYAIKQPLNKKYCQKLELYLDSVYKGKENVALKRKLVSILVKKYKKRIGIKIIAALLKPILHHKVVGEENVKEHSPAIFVFNHGDMYGPIVSNIYLPFDCTPWILDKMLDKEKITLHIYEETIKDINWIPKILKYPLSRMVSPILLWAMQSVEPIPVFRGLRKDVVVTFKLTVESLEAGDNILLFPENPKGKYSESISEFYTGFARLGEFYYKKTGKEITFYPVCANSKEKTIYIGEGIKYNSKNQVRQERNRIVDELKINMEKFSV